MNLNKYIDHTLLKPEAPKEAVLKLIEEAKKYDFCSVCINPAWVSLAAKELENTDVKVCTVIGFDLGATTTASKVFETADAVKNGADEVDMVINLGFLKSKEYDLVKEDIAEVVKAANGKTVKVIIETCLLTKEEIVKVCQLAKEAGADFVKTSTGFNSGGATVEDVKLMKETVGEMYVKASGGIRDLDTALKMIEAGADRLGVSAGIQIIEEYRARNAN